MYSISYFLGGHPVCHLQPASWVDSRNLMGQIPAYIWAHRCVIDFYNEEKNLGMGVLFVTKSLSDPYPTSSKQKKEPLGFFLSKH